VLERLNHLLSIYPGAKALLVRKTQTSLTSTALQTYQRKVLHRLDGVTFYGGSAVEPAQFRYPNGSRLMVGGMDNATRIMSGEYDLIAVNEATELLESDWEALTTRLRNGVVPYQQITGDCNPDAPTHWIKRRQAAERLTLLESRHEDNPELWDAERGAWTDRGAAYISKLDALTGVRYLRLRKGLWAAAEGLVYDGWDPAVHLVDRFDVPPAWPRYWSIDFGYTNPFVCQFWAEDPDGRLYLYREIYHTQRLVEDHAETIQALCRDDQRPRAIICDHDAEDRATLSRKLGLPTLPAYKVVSAGIQAVAERLKPAGDGRPRLFVLRDSRSEPDPALVDAGLPTCTADEFSGYVWDTRMNVRAGEQPLKKADHGLDSLRYLVSFVDDLALDPEAPEGTVVWDDRVAISPF
jgi:hypothetical protein